MEGGCLKRHSAAFFGNVCNAFLHTVKPPPLIWKATKSGSKLNISWTPPEVLSLDFWEFNINYTECDKIKVGGTIIPSICSSARLSI